MNTLVSTAGAVIEPVPLLDVLPPGAKAGPWIVERELGRGGMGAVYAVVHEDIGKRAALKVVHPRLIGAGFNPERMLLEAKVVNQVGHPNIVDIFETGTLPDGRPYIVMERLDGQLLAFRAADGKILPDQVIAILLQVCDALIAAHTAGVIHRDLKLDNVFLVDNPEAPNRPRVKLLDWGIAKVIHHDVRHTVEGQVVGTPQYLSPEQARGGEVSPQTDVYSLGVMAYELFLEALPFEAETAAEIMVMHLRNAPPPPRALWPDIPAALEQLLLAMLAKQPDHRPTMLEVARGLEQIGGELERRRTGALAAAPPEASPPPAPRTRSSVGAGSARTMQAEWTVRTRRWQYVAGVVALAASAALFAFSRGVDRATAAVAPPAPPAVIEVDDARPPAAARPQPAVAPPDIEMAPVTVAVSPSAPARPRPVARAAQRRSAVGSRSSNSKAPAAPRRAAPIDPDGTIEPYR